MRYFEYIAGSSYKFWTITRTGNSAVVLYGRIGTAGQTNEKRFGTANQAITYCDRMIIEKLYKGYVEKAVPASMRNLGGNSKIAGGAKLRSKASAIDEKVIEAIQNFEETTGKKRKPQGTTATKEKKPRLNLQVTTKPLKLLPKSQFQSTSQASQPPQKQLGKPQKNETQGAVPGERLGRRVVI